MFWIFAAVVLVLMVVHRGFRKVAFWVGGVASTLASVWIVIVVLHDNRPSQPIAQTQSKCTGDAAIDAAFPCSDPVPDAYLAQSRDAASCDAAKKSKDSRTAFFACGGAQEDPDIPASALK